MLSPDDHDYYNSTYCICVCMCIYVCINIYIYVCVMYVSMCVYVCMCTCIVIQYVKYRICINFVYFYVVISYMNHVS